MSLALLKEFEAINEKFGDPAIMENPDAMDKLITKQGRDPGKARCRQCLGTG